VKLRSLVLAILAAFGLALVAVPAASAEQCHILPGGTTGDEEKEPVPDRAGSPTDKGPGARGANPTVGGLPARVDLRAPWMGQNRNYYFAVKGGRLYVKPNHERTGRKGAWQHVPAPDCLEGDIRSIDVDDDELTAINSENQILGMDQALSIPSRFNWTSRWGFPFWLGDGYTIPADAAAWAWTVISPRESRYWVDPAGNHHEVGEGKVSHVLSLRGDRRRITMNDPWLPRDRSYEICGPRRGTFRMSNIAASGSVVFVIGERGDMYTRLWDFDIAGLDNIFFRYSYEDQRGLADPAIQLPGAHWVRQPKIPGKITNRISITTVGRGTLHRTLRVEGRNAKGVPGFWQKDLYALNRGSSAWRFVSTPKARLTGRALINPRGDSSAYRAGAIEGTRYVSAGPIRAEIPDFNVYCSRSLLRVSLEGGGHLDLNLFLDDQVRVLERARGLDDEPRPVTGTIAVTDAARRLAARDGEARAFLEGVLGGREFTSVPIEATTAKVDVPGLGEFAAATAASYRVPDPAFRSLGLTARRNGLRFRFETMTESPASIVVTRISGRPNVKNRVVARLTRTGSFTWKPRHLKRGGYRVAITSEGLGGRPGGRVFKFRRTASRFKMGG